MRFHGIWDRYELYDLEKDPHEMNNLLGSFKIRHEAGTLDNLIRRTAEEPTRALFVDLSDRLDQLLEETGCRREPSWKKID